MQKKYYSIRTGKNKNFNNYDTHMLKRLFKDLYYEFNSAGYFQEYFGINCTDGYIPGKIGHDIEAQIFSALRKDNMYPSDENIDNYKEDDLFDIIEFLFDNISKPVRGSYHGWNQCGTHFDIFNQEEGQQVYIKKMNLILADYSTGYQLSNTGVIHILEKGHLIDITAHKVNVTEIGIKDKVDFAVNKFKQSRNNTEEKRIAIRELADILEVIRPTAKEYLTRKDESTLYDIANNFGIRHNNSSQKNDYNKEVWYNWIFYTYLNTIYTLLEIDKDVTPGVNK